MTNANFLLTIMNTQSREKALRIACSRAMTKGNVLAPVVQTSDSAIHRINHYPADSIIIDFRNTYLVDIVIYLVDSAIQCLNNRGLIFKRIFSTTCNSLGICMDIDVEHLY